MKNSQMELNELMRKYDASEYDDVDDFAVAEMADEPLDKLLSDRGISFEQALIEEQNDRDHYKQIADENNISVLVPSFMWDDVIKLCKQNFSEERYEILLWLLAGGLFSENYDEELGDEFTVRRWLGITERVEEYRSFLDTYKCSRKEYDEIIRKIDAEKLSSRKFSETDSERVFSLLCENGFANDCENKEVLLDNLTELDSVIKANDFLKPIKPLIYFQTYVRHRQKLLNKQAFSPNFKNLFEYKQYGISSDNGKNFAQYADYCDLYTRLKMLFTDADRGLCDYGFIKCSNLADWYRSLPDLGYECDIPDGMPLTLDRFVEDMCVTCFDDPMDLAWNTEDLRVKFPTLYKAVKETVCDLDFDELPEFAADQHKFCERFFTGELLRSVRDSSLDAAWQLLIEQTRHVFDALLNDEVLRIFNRYIRG